MRKMLLLIAFLFPTVAFADSDLERLAKEGYAVISQTKLQDSNFEGCDYDRVLVFRNGFKFKCTEYNYNYAYNPDVLILKHIYSNDYKVIIDDEEFRGRLYK